MEESFDKDTIDDNHKDDPGTRANDNTPQAGAAGAAAESTDGPIQTTDDDQQKQQQQQDGDNSTSEPILPKEEDTNETKTNETRSNAHNGTMNPTTHQAEEPPQDPKFATTAAHDDSDVKEDKDSLEKAGSNHLPDTTTQDEHDPSESSSEDSESNDDEHSPEGGLSDYEKLRLARIARNRQYLAQLGLEQTSQSIRSAQQKSKPQRTSSAVVHPPRRSSLSRRTKQKGINYALPSSLFGPSATSHNNNKAGDKHKSHNPTKTGNSEGEKKDTDASQPLHTSLPKDKDDDDIDHKEDSLSNNPSGGPATDDATQDLASTLNTTLEPPKPRAGKKRSQSTRMDITIHREFLRIRAEKRNALKLAKKCKVRAEQQVRYWTRLQDMQLRKRHRITKFQLEQAAQQEERTALGGWTMREWLHHVDGRLSLELQPAALRYDAHQQHALRDWERQRRHHQVRQQHVLQRSLEDFPKALQAARTVLQSVLVERAPKDPPPPRRSKRTTNPEDEEDHPTRTNQTKSPTRNTKQAPSPGKSTVPGSPPAKKKAKRGRPPKLLGTTTPQTTTTAFQTGENAVPSAETQHLAMFSAASIRGEADDDDDEDPAHGPPDPDDPARGAAAVALGGTKAPVQDDPAHKKKATARPKKPKAKIVGGWISPDLAHRLDRRWLIRTTRQQVQALPLHQQQQDANALLSHCYVPQVGDALLYYPQGHKLFLQDVPDVLGKKTRQVTRLPLWERAQGASHPKSKKAASAATAAETPNPDTTSNTNAKTSTPPKESQWWTPEWIQEMERYDGELDDEEEEGEDRRHPRWSVASCPILCIVQATCPEFPPDSSKVLKKQKEDGTHEFVFESSASPKSKKSSPKRSKHGMMRSTPPKLRLAVTLRPVTPIGWGPHAPPRDLPPTFSVVTVPSLAHCPFLVPFAWAYSVSQKLRVGDWVVASSRTKVSSPTVVPESQITSIETYSTSDNGDAKRSETGPLLQLLNRLLQRYNGNWKAAVMADTEFAQQIPPTDVSLVVKTLGDLVSSATMQQQQGGNSSMADQTNTSTETPARPTTEELSLWKIICLTLPLWESVSLTKSYDTSEEQFRASPWELTPMGAKRLSAAGALSSSHAPGVIGACGLNNLDESLRVKLCECLKGFIQEYPSAALFVDEVTDAIAPSYSCAIPVPMFFYRILARLGTTGTMPEQASSSSSSCHYRSVGALLSDVNLIRENCLLYNNPESEVVEQALVIVSMAKDAIAKVVRVHNREISEIRKADLERQRLVMRHCGSPQASAMGHPPDDMTGGRSAPLVCRISNLYKEEVYQKWLQQVHPPNATSDGQSSREMTDHDDVTCWIPQAGDRIQYSRKRHAKFVMGHYPSLEAAQCSIVTTEVNDNAKDSTESGMQAIVSVSSDQNNKTETKSEPPSLSPVNGKVHEPTQTKIHENETLASSPNVSTLDNPECADKKENPMESGSTPAATTTTSSETGSPVASNQSPSLNSGMVLPSTEAGEKAVAVSPPSSMETVETSDADAMTERPSRSHDASHSNTDVGIGGKDTDDIFSERLNSQSTATGQSSNNDDWESAVVHWTRASFPKLPSKKSNEDALTFSTNSTMLALGVFFESSKKLEVIYWRPCLFQFDRNEDSDERQICPTCGLDASESFLQRETANQRTSQDPAQTESDLSHVDRCASSSVRDDGRRVGSTLSEEENASLHRCLGLLKRRCIRCIPPDFLDERLTKANIAEGYVPPQTKVGIKSLPSYDELILKKEMGNLTHDTRKHGQRHPLVDEQLVSKGYVPPWLALVGEDTGGNGPQWYDTISPWSSLSLELILLRLENRYYRHREAVENDIIEAYISICFLLLGRDAGRKKNPLSMKRIARNLSLTKPRGRPPLNPENAVESSEEDKWIGKMEHVRELYATALLCISNTQMVERLNGLNQQEVTDPKPMNQPLVSEDPKRAEARKKLAHILMAFGRDPLVNRSSALSSGRLLKVTCGGENVAVERHFQKVSVVPAQVGEKEVSVTVVLDNRPIVYLNKAPCRDSLEASVSDDKNETVTVRCDGETVSMPLVPAESAVTLLENSLRFEECDFEANDSLARIFFGTPGRMQPCARCQAHRRSLFSCRVRRRHANCDFDWRSVFNDSGSLDKLMLQLDPMHRPPAPPVNSIPITTPETATVTAAEANSKLVAQSPSVDVGVQKEEEGKEEIDECRPPMAMSVDDEKTQSKDKEEGKEEGNADDSQKKESNPSEKTDTQAGDTINGDSGQKEVDAGEMLEKAQSIMTRAEEVLAGAQKYAASADIMSKQFIEAAIPVDEEDGHFVYCIVCGLSGNLVCCDGCANVVHAKCVGLDKVPEGEWFCEECQIKKDASVQTAQCSLTNGTIPDHDVRLPFGRFEFDPEVVTDLNKMVDELQQANPERKMAQSKNPNDENGMGANGKTPFDALSSNTRKFLQSIGIKTAEELVATKTTTVGGEFREWRKRMGMSEMKTSGEVASVSMWKRACRDAAEEMGIDLNRGSGAGDKNMESSEEDSSDDEESEDDTRQRPRRETAVRGRSLADLDDPIDALSAMAKEFFRSIGIESGEKVVEVKTSEVGRKFGKWRKRKKLPKLKGSGEVATISAWKTTCRNAITAITQAKKTPAKKTKSTEKLVSPRSKRAQERLKKSPAKNTPSSTSKNQQTKKRKRGRPPKKSDVAPRKDDEKTSSSNALDVLTKPARDFLDSINIESAEHFLSLRTCDVADKFAKWRHKQGLTKLRGSGNGATISAWRSLCRKALEELEASENSESDDEDDEREGEEEEDEETGHGDESMEDGDPGTRSENENANNSDDDEGEEEDEETGHDDESMKDGDPGTRSENENASNSDDDEEDEETGRGDESGEEGPKIKEGIPNESPTPNSQVGEEEEPSGVVSKSQEEGWSRLRKRRRIAPRGNVTREVTVEDVELAKTEESDKLRL